MSEINLKPYCELWDAKVELERRNAVLLELDQARDKQRRMVGYVIGEACPEVKDMDAKSLRAWMRGRDVIIDCGTMLPLLSNSVEQIEFVRVFWEWLSPSLVNICQPVPLLFAMYLDFCDMCGRKSRLSRRNFVAMLAEVCRDQWVCPVDADGSLSRVNPHHWVLGREAYVESLLARSDERFGDGPMSAESLSGWLPPFREHRRPSKGGAFYLRCVYDWCHAHNVTPRQAIESRGWVDVEDVDLEQFKPWERTKENERWCMAYQEALSAAQSRLIKLSRREKA